MDCPTVLFPFQFAVQNKKMARIWMEARSGNYHIPPGYNRSLASPHAGTLITEKIMKVSVASFTFQFASVEQIRDYLAYYERKIHPSSTADIGSADQREAQRRFEKLPMYLLEEPNAPKCLML